MKEALLRMIETVREKEAADLLPRVDDSPSEAGAWNAKDHLAHLSAWRLLAAEEVDAVRAGGSPPGHERDVDARNADIYAAACDLPAADVVASAARSWETLAAALAACEEDDLFRPRPGFPDQPLWQLLPGNTYVHLAQHFGYLFSARGDDATAEAAAVWAHDLAVATFPGEQRRGVAEYNLGCFYAERGRLAEALPYLETGIGLHPGLRAWARHDSDLDPIRSAPELEDLLAER